MRTLMFPYQIQAQIITQSHYLVLVTQLSIFAQDAHYALEERTGMIQMKCKYFSTYSFGGSHPLFSADCIVALDACFTQKSRKSKSNQAPAPRFHPETVFISPEEVKAMEVLVETTRSGSRSRTQAKTSATSSGTSGPLDTGTTGASGSSSSGGNTSFSNSDIIEPGMSVPASVLDECGASFIAADEKRVKASTSAFSDTGLMVLLCRHDQVLWLVNMTSAGEKQYYALALLNCLFKHLPKEMHVGVLYDIGCQLHRSCTKWGFLEEFQDRITWAISIFHAYSHSLVALSDCILSTQMYWVWSY